jgi:hypothetical protein
VIDPSIFIHFIFYQSITINATTPCFLNATAGADIWQNCYEQAGNDYLNFALLGWQWITGGNFSMVIVSLFVLMTYIKYQKVVYPLLIGTMFLPFSWFLFPTSFLSWAFIMGGCGVALIIGYIIISQTNES